jgi:hypothetical protein
VTDRRRRFLGLERRRQDAIPEERPKTGGRFGAVEKPGPVAANTVPGEATDRFRAPEERPPDVERSREGEQPFVRCAHCETDNTVYAATCHNCQADLDTPEQRAFNERLWAARKAESAREAAVLAARREEQERASVEERRARRILAEQMAREVGESERRRLEGGSSAWGWLGGGRPVGFRLLELIPDQRMRAAAVAAVLAILTITALSGARKVAVVAFFVILSLFLPSRRYWRFHRW